MHRMHARDQFVSGGAANDYLAPQESYGLFGRPTGEWRLTCEHFADSRRKYAVLSKSTLTFSLRAW